MATVLLSIIRLLLLIQIPHHLIANPANSDIKALPWDFEARPIGSCFWNRSVSIPEEKRFCGINRANSNYCRQSGGFFAAIKYKDPNPYTCGFELNCTSGTYISENCACTLSKDDCYHPIGTCTTPKGVTLPKGTCSEQLWDLLKPEFCSIETLKPGCDPTPITTRVSFIIDSSGKTRYVKSLMLRSKYMVNAESAYFTEGNPMGEKATHGTLEYCTRFGEGPQCHRGASHAGHRYRIYSGNQEFQEAVFSVCNEPIYCHGNKGVVAYAWEGSIGESVCTSCSVTCTDLHFKYNLPIDGAKTMHLCGAAGCFQVALSNKVGTVDRPYVYQVEIRAVKIIVYFEANYRAWSETIMCDLVDVCEAIDCWWCMQAWTNIRCYSTFQCIIMMSFLTIVLIMTCCIVSIAKAICSCCKPCFQLAVKIHKSLSGIKKRKYKKTDKVDEEELKSLVEESSEEEDTKVVHQYRPRSFLIVPSLLLIILLLPSAQSSGVTKDTNSEEKITTTTTKPQETQGVKLMGLDCHSTQVYNILSTECTLLRGKYTCKLMSTVTIDLAGSNQNVCLLYMSKNVVVKAISIRLEEASYTCQKESLYFTRDYRMHHDHVIRCPGTDSCTAEKCERFGNNDSVDGLISPTKTINKYCLQGDACWANGCFLCTHSCHFIQYYAMPISKSVFEIFECSEWKEHIKIKVLTLTKQSEYQQDINLLNGEMHALDSATSITFASTLPTMLKTLDSKFITDGAMVAKVDASSPGQPISGTLGQVQCFDKASATKSDNCTMAHGICFCSTSGASDVCTCSDVQMSNIFDKESTLPLFIENNLLRYNGENVVLEPKLEGQGKVIVKSEGTVSVQVDPEFQCELTIVKVSGCYSCLSGVKVLYTCSSVVNESSVISCTDDVNSVIHCGPSTHVNSFRFLHSERIADFDCTVGCMKENVKLKTVLDYIPHETIGLDSRVVLDQDYHNAKTIDWASSLWNSSYWHWPITTIAVLLCVFMLIKLFLKLLGF